MTYRIVWKYNGQFYTEYGNLDKMTEICEFLENHNDFELVEITWIDD
jgi:hypothetical protein